LTIAEYRVGDGGGGRDAKLSLAEGLLRAVVSTQKGPPHFEVDTATGMAPVRSTDSFIEAQPGSTEVGALEGRVSLKSVATGTEIVIPARWVPASNPGGIRSPQGCGPGSNSTISSGGHQLGSGKRISYLHPCCYN
jgi:hypothetical protein